MDNVLAGHHPRRYPINQEPAERCLVETATQARYIDAHATLEQREIDWCWEEIAQLRTALNAAREIITDVTMELLERRQHGELIPDDGRMAGSARGRTDRATGIS